MTCSHDKPNRRRSEREESCSHTQSLLAGMQVDHAVQAHLAIILLQPNICNYPKIQKMKFMPIWEHEEIYNGILNHLVAAPSMEMDA